MTLRDALAALDAVFIRSGWYGYVQTSNGTDFFPVVIADMAWEEGLARDLGDAGDAIEDEGEATA